MKIFKPPMNIPRSNKGISIFLGGSIEQGKAIDWQKEITDYLTQQFPNEDITLFNPRRDDWNPNLEQSIANPVFRGQVLWEIDCILKSNINVFFIQGDTLSPITLYEIGLVSIESWKNKRKVIVCCEPGFWRKGNVDVVSLVFKMNSVSSIDELKVTLKDMIVNGV